MKYSFLVLLFIGLMHHVDAQTTTDSNLKQTLDSLSTTTFQEAQSGD